MGLITDIQQIRDHVNIDSSLKLAIMNPHINFTERYIKKVLGTAQYLALKTAVDTTSTTQEQDALLEMIYPALGRLSVASWAVAGALSMSSAGIRRIEDSNEKTAFKYQEDALVRRLVQEGYEAIDDLVEFLEENEGDYTLWANDGVAYTKFKQFFINTTEEFEMEYSIGGSRLTFRAFYGLLKHVDYMAMRPILGADFYDELKNEIKDRSVSAENEALLAEFIRPAAAHLVIAEAMDVLPVQISESGVRVVEILQSFPSDAMEKNAPAEVRAPKRAAAIEKAKQYMNGLDAELKGNASESKYATYFADVASENSTDGNTDTTKGVYRA